jgi:hypothetical protein
VKKHVAALAALSTVAVSLVVAAPAQAYDRDAYVYAAGHMVRSGDIPAALGDFGQRMSFNASPSGNTLYLCAIGEKEVTAPGGAYSYSAYFNEPQKGGNGNSLSTSVTTYASAQKAISAFETLQKRITNCKGATTQTWSDDDGTTETSSSLTTNGKVPAVTEVGVESVFVNQNYLSTSSDSSERYSNDQYTVYTLLNDAILSTTYNTGNLENIPTKLRKKVNEVAFVAIDRWLD